MRAVDAAVLVLEREGVNCAFGVPGAAINPFYSAMRQRGSIRHILARHVEGASHMADGYTRAKAGNIGVCIGTSGPAGTDMITGLYTAQADSLPILCITGQAPRARLYKEDFQAVDIESIAKPVTKWAVTVREPALVPQVFQQAFHLMRSGRPGPVLIDLPVDVQLGEIEFDIDTYEPLKPYKPAASRRQVERAIAMMQRAERPLIVAGGGVINADASALLVRFAEITGVPVIPTLMGWGCIPDDHRLMAGMVGLQTSHRYGNATFLQSDFVFGIGNRWANRHTGSIEKYTAGRKFVHIDIEPDRIGRIFESANAGIDRALTIVSCVMPMPMAVALERLAVADPTTTTALNLSGSNTGNELLGNAGANVLSGRGGIDLLGAFAGNDRLFGGTETNVFRGGAGQDSFHFQGAALRHWIGPAGRDGLHRRRRHGVAAGVDLRRRRLRPPSLSAPRQPRRRNEFSTTRRRGTCSSMPMASAQRRRLNTPSQPLSLRHEIRSRRSWRGRDGRTDIAVASQL